MEKAYIYEIRNKIDNKVYYGSTINFVRRFKNHLFLLQKNKHHNIHLQRAWNRDGSDSFEFKIVEEFHINQENKKQLILEKEQKYLDLKPEYNICKKAGSVMDLRWKIKKEKVKNFSHVGENNNFKSKLTVEQVIEIRQLYKNKKFSGYRLAKMYNVSLSLVYLIIHNKKWKVVSEEAKKN